MALAIFCLRNAEPEGVQKCLSSIFLELRKLVKKYDRKIEKAWRKGRNIIFRRTKKHHKKTNFIEYINLKLRGGGHN